MGDDAHAQHTRGFAGRDGAAARPKNAKGATVLCLGEALIDVVEGADGRVSEHVGGSLLNVACGLGALEVPTALAAWWGRDERGDRLARHAREHGVAVWPGTDGAAATSVAHALVDAAGKASYEFDFTWELPRIGEPGEGSPRHLHTGSLAATVEPGGAEVVAGLERWRASATVSYDPNARPALMGSPDAVRDRIERCVALADVVKASDEDLAWLYPGEDPAEVARRWAQAGPALVVVTWGGDGCLAVRAGEASVDRDFAERRWPAPAADVVDTVGAGDSFMAGLLSGLLDAGYLGGSDARARLHAASLDDVAPAIERALAMAQVTVAHAGAYSPSREAVVPTTTAPSHETRSTA